MKTIEIQKLFSIVALSLGLLVIGSSPIYSQTSPKPVTLEQAIQLANEQNNSIKTAQYQVDYNHSLKGTSTDIGKLNANLMYGQYNSYYRDNNITISQTIPFPTTMGRQSQYYNATTKSAEYNLEMTQNELEYKVKAAYYNLQFAKSRKLLLMRLDTLYVTFLKAADLRLQTGESNMLEKATAQSQLYEIRTWMTQNEADIQIYQTQLQTLLNSPEPVTTVETVIEKRIITFSQDSVSVSGNPALQYFKQQIEVANSSKALERSKLMPDLTIGYYNQSLYGTVNYQNTSEVSGSSTRFQGVMVGVSFPLWIKPQLSRIKANEANVNAAQSNFEYYENNLQGEYENAYQEYIKYRNSMEYYEVNALPTAEIIKQNAMKNYKSGNIGYLEFSQGLNRVITIEQNYLDILNQYNQSIIYIEYLIGNK